MYIVYDNTFEGLLSALYVYYTQPDIHICRASTALPLFASTSHDTQPQNADKLARRIRRRFGEAAYENLYFAFLIGAEDVEQTVIDYIAALLEKGDAFPHAVSKMHDWRKRILNTVYRYYGFLRFSERQEILYAAYAPDYDISLLLADYFAQRLSYAPFVIHDCKRNTMLLHRNHQYLFTDTIEEFSEEKLEQNELYIQKLFRSYFDSVNIVYRTNARLQRSNFPLKMRTYAFEFDKPVE